MVGASFSVAGLLIVGVVGVAVLAILWRGLSAFVGIFQGMQAGHATLNCPRCGKETVPTNGRCTSCGSEL